MTTHKDTAGIIERLEAASGPDREIDGAIALSLNQDAKLWTPEWWSGGRDEFIRWPDPKPGEARYEQVERYTSSIDAALSLVPEGWNWDACGQDVLGISKPFAMLGIPGVTEATGRGATPAIALCIAALRARAHKGEG